MKKLQLLCLSAALSLVGLEPVLALDGHKTQGATATITPRGREVWVFRTVLDTKPRMLVLALAPNLWAAYNTQDGTLGKVWRGGMKFSGTIYDGKHGPQPVSKGPALLDRLEDSRENWQVLQNGEPVKFKVQYAGHKMQKDQVILMTKLLLDNGTTITVEERPEAVWSRVQNGGAKGAASSVLTTPGLERVMSVTGAQGYTVNTWVSSGQLIQATDWLVPSDAFKKVERKETYTQAGTVVQEQGWLSLSNAEPTKIYHYYQAQ